MPFLILLVLAFLGGEQASPHLPSACSHGARTTLARGASVSPGSIAAERFRTSNGAAACRLRAVGTTAIARLDSAPQPYQRMEREQVEFWQNVEWSHEAARAAPRPVRHLGLDGYWFPVQNRLLTTDGVRLITIKVRAPSMGPSERKAAAIRLARTYLGPLHKPPGY